MVFNGKSNSGAVLASGSYSVNVLTETTISGSIVPGQAAKLVTVDLVKPTGGVAASPGTFYPVSDGYLDTVSLRVQANERLTVAKVEVLRSGAKVFSGTNRATGSSAAATSWNGRKAGRIVASGTYTVRYLLQDRAGNKSYSRNGRVTVSPKKLVKHSGQKVVTPKASNTDTAIGFCSEVGYPYQASWPGSFAYLSNYHVVDYDSCGYDSTDDLAFAQHAITLPAANKYGTIRVDAYGKAAVSGYADTAALLYDDNTGETTSTGGILGPGLKWHTGDTVQGARFVTGGHRFKWWAGTSDSNFYAIKEFRVTYSYFLLK